MDIDVLDEDDFVVLVHAVLVDPVRVEADGSVFGYAGIVSDVRQVSL